MSENSKPQLESVDGIEIIVDTKKREYPVLPVKEWLLAQITDVKKQLPTTAGWKPRFHWTFNLVDEQFDGRKIWYDTSMIATLDSNFSALYKDVMGLSDLPDGKVLRPTDLVGRKCYIMVEPARKNPKFQVIASIKTYAEKDTVAPVAKQAAQVSTQKEKAAPVAQAAPQQSEEIDLSEVNLDDL